MALPEFILTSCKHSQHSVCIWDYTTGNLIHSYKNGGIVASKTLNLVGYEYILTVEEEKPLTHLWSLNSQEPTKKQSTIFPDRVKVMTLCPNSTYLAAGIGPKFYIWQITSGKLLTIQKKNFQAIACIKFSCDGKFVAVGGEDGMLIVYNVENLVCLHTNLLSQTETQIEPLYTKQDHSLPITDIFVTQFRQNLRIATVSSDQTCKIYNLVTGILLINLVFEEPLTAVIVDASCWNLFVGLSSGKIQQFRLKNPPRSIEHHVTDDLTFEGHEKRVTCLDLGVANGVLVSGSEDNFVFVWEIFSRQILRRIEHKGAINNIMCVSAHGNFSTQDIKFSKVVRTLERNLDNSDDFLVSCIQKSDVEESDDDGPGNKDILQSRAIWDLKAENLKLTSVNHQLYEAAMNLSRKYNYF